MTRVYVLKLKAVFLGVVIGLKACIALPSPAVILGSIITITSMLSSDLKRQLVRRASVSHQTAVLYKDSFGSTYSDSGV